MPLTHCFYDGIKKVDLQKIYTPKMRTQMDIDFYVNEASEFIGIPVKRLIHKTRRQPICDARQMIMKVLFNKRFTYKSIGDFFGGRDHSTVIHACKKVNNLCATDQLFTAKFKELENYINTIK